MSYNLYPGHHEPNQWTTPDSVKNFNYTFNPSDISYKKRKCAAVVTERHLSARRLAFQIQTNPENTVRNQSHIRNECAKWHICKVLVYHCADCNYIDRMYYFTFYSLYFCLLWTHCGQKSCGIMLTENSIKRKLCLTYLLYSRVCFQLLYFSFS